jgi:hypothetical protein
MKRFLKYLKILFRIKTQLGLKAFITNHFYHFSVIRTTIFDTHKRKWPEAWTDPTPFIFHEKIVLYSLITLSSGLKSALKIHRSLGKAIKLNLKVKRRLNFHSISTPVVSTCETLWCLCCDRTSKTIKNIPINPIIHRCMQKDTEFIQINSLIVLRSW